jgi:methionine aminopeptidase
MGKTDLNRKLWFGFHGDCCGTFLVRQVDDVGKRLVQASQIATKKAVQVCAPDVKISRIADVIW